MKERPATVDEYLATLDEAKRSALERLRRQIRAAAPGAVECIRYGVPSFKLDGRLLVSFGAAAKHCSFFPGDHPIRTLGAELDGYDTSKGTIRFAAEQPLPAALVRRIVRLRVAQNAALAAAARARRRR